MGSRSILAGIIWLVLMGFAAVEGVETVIVLLDKVGVVRLTAGRDDRSAGLMSGILAMVVVGVLCMYVLGTALRCDAELRAVGGGRWSYGLASDVACRKSPYRDAADSVMRASGGFWGLCNPNFRFKVMILMGCGLRIDADFRR